MYEHGYFYLYTHLLYTKLHKFIIYLQKRKYEFRRNILLFSICCMIVLFSINNILMN